MAEDVLSMYFDVSLGVDALLGLNGAFESVSGLSLEVDYETYIEGGAESSHYFYKQMAPQTLVLERGLVTGVDQFALWMEALKLGSIIRLGGTITLLSATGKVQKIWIITDAYPIKYVGPTLKSSPSGFAVSRIELAHNGVF